MLPDPNSVDLDKTQHNVASDQGLQCLLTIDKKQQNRPDTPEMTTGPVQHMRMEESTSIHWVNY